MRAAKAWEKRRERKQDRMDANGPMKHVRILENKRSEIFELILMKHNVLTFKTKKRVSQVSPQTLPW